MDSYMTAVIGISIGMILLAFIIPAITGPPNRKYFIYDVAGFLIVELAFMIPAMIIVGIVYYFGS